MNKKERSDSRPGGRLAPNPAELAWTSAALAALASRARRGELILLYADETILWRFALPRAGWGRKASRARLATRPRARARATARKPSNARPGGRSAPGTGSPAAYGSVCLGRSSMAPRQSSPRACPIVRRRGGANPSSEGPLWPHGQSGGHGGRPQWQPPGASARIDAAPLARAVSLASLAGAWRTPP